MAFGLHRSIFQDEAMRIPKQNGNRFSAGLFRFFNCAGVFHTDDGETHRAELETTVHNEILKDPEQISALLADIVRALATKLSPPDPSEKVSHSVSQ
jgi:hypothetical protein